MPRPFVSEFLLPLVRGGTLEVGRPLVIRDVAALEHAHRSGARSPVEVDAALELAAARRRAVLPLVASPPPLPLDESTWRLGCAVHDLLALSHPRIGAGPGAAARVERVAGVAAELAALGAPTSLQQALARHSLLARLPEVARFDHTVRFWLGRRTFVGRRPPARMLALPRLRNVSVETVRRTWLRDVGVQASARPAFAALTEASPLGEALDPLRLDPAWSWGRVLTVLKFPPLCRLVAGRLVELGVATTGDALAEALYRYVSLQDTAGAVPASPQAVAFALGFLAHLVWLDHLFDRPVGSGQGMGEAAAAAGAAGPPARPSASGEPWGRAGRPAVAAAGSPGPAAPAGRELALLLAAAFHEASHLIWPADVSPQSELGQGFSRRLERLFQRHVVKDHPRWRAAADVVRLAQAGERPRWAGDAV